MKQYLQYIILFGIALTARISVAGPILYLDDVAGELGTVDVGTGATTVIGSMGAIMTDIAFAPNGDLYGITFTDLYRVNANTGAATLIGSLGLTGANALVFGTSGTLYAAASNSTSLFSVNVATGAATALGNTGFDSAGDLAFNDGQLYMSSTGDQLIRIDQSTFAGSDVGNFGFSSVFGLATGDNGVLYGAAGTQIFSVNTATGAGSLVTDYGGHGLGSANGTSFYAEAHSAPDRSSTFGLLLVSGALVLLMRQVKRLDVA